MKSLLLPLSVVLNLLIYPQVLAARLTVKGVADSKHLKEKHPDGLVGGKNFGFIELNSYFNDGTSKKWTQTYKGVQLHGSQLTTRHDSSGQITNMFGSIVREDLDMDVSPHIKAEQALTSVLREWNHQSLPRSVIIDQEVELAIAQQNDGTEKLVWRCSYSLDGYESHRKNTRQRYTVGPAWIVGFVDAYNGTVLKTMNNVQDLKIEAIVGNDKVGITKIALDVTDLGSGNCRHKDSQRYIEVRDLKNKQKTSPQMTADFVCNDANHTDWDQYTETHGYSPRNEAYKAAVYYHDMWKGIFNDDPPHVKASRTLYLNVHYGLKVENAFFNGAGFYFGDGGSVFFPLTSLDVVCHEIGHSVTYWDNGSKLEYSGEPGGMNEAYSDILGETCDMYHYERTSFLIGEDITQSWYKGGSIRDMCDPESKGHRGSYNQFQATDNVHSSSGIYNKAWCNLSKTSGWDYKKAFKVFTAANLNYWYSAITMHCGACGVQKAAADIFGYSEADVVAAFATVDVKCSLC